MLRKKFPKQDKKFIVLASVATIMIVGVLAYYYVIQGSSRQTATSPYYPKALEGKGTAPSTTNASLTPTIQPTQTPIPTGANAITITSPTQGETVTSGTKVNGTAKITTNKLYFRLKAGKSGQLANGVISVSANSAQPIPFSFELNFTNQVFGGTDQGNLEVYTAGSNGVESSLASILVNIQG